MFLGQTDLSNNKNLKGLYAQARTSETAEFENQREKLSTSSTANFANPVKNTAEIGVRSGMIVADFGSGSGHYVFAMANSVGEQGTVYAIDVQKDLLTKIENEAQKRGFDNVQTVWADIEKKGGTKIADSVTDLVLVSNVAFQVDDKDGLFKEAYRILKAGGILAVIDWTESFSGMGPVSGDIFDLQTAKQTVVGNGFSFKNSFDAGAHHYGLIFFKGSENDLKRIQLQEQNNKQTDIERIINQEL